MAKYYLRYRYYGNEAMYELCTVIDGTESVVFYGAYANCIDYMERLMRDDVVEVKMSEQFLTKKVNKYVKKERIA